MTTYWTGKVVIKTEDDNGKIKKTTEQFLIDAVSATEAEVKIYKEYEGWNGEFEIQGVNKSRIIKILS
jgi:hypothetical protein|tara:strand:+ start:391 stop:594 length:204 start_codon:yes stop_codon:yes gene_type:complete